MKIVLYISFWIFLSILNGNSSANIKSNSLLFCLNPLVDELVINHLKLETNYEDLNKILNQYNIKSIDKWLSHARHNEKDNDIYLSKIYKVTLEKNNIAILYQLFNDLKELNIFHSLEYEYYRVPTYVPNDSQYSQQWFLPQIEADNAWNLWDIDGGQTPGNQSILLASIDTGVDWDHPDLRDNIWNNLGEDADGDGVTIIQQGGSWIFDPGDQNAIDDDGNGYIDDFIGWDSSGYSGGEDNDPMPPPGVNNGGTWAHGTHVAGLLSARTNNNTGIASVAFNSKIMCVKVSTGDQSYPYITHGYDGILYAAQAGYDAGTFTIMNNSWGGIGYSQYEQAIINVAHNDYNAIVLAAGGNGDDNGFGTDEFAHYPSSYDNVLSVCPLGQGDSWNHWATYHQSIDLASPGEGIRSTRIGNGYTSWSGSSMATPIVASVIGLMRSMNPNWNNEKLITMVLGTSNPIIYSINTEDYLSGKLGRGRVDALKAVATPLFPKIELIDTDIYIYNDSNGIIEQGEAVEARIILANNEDWGNAINVFGSLELVIDDPNITITQPTTNFGNAEPGGILFNEDDPFNIFFGLNSNVGSIEFLLKIISNVDDYIQNEQSLYFTLDVQEVSILLGDVNQDSIINILDIINIVNIILGETPTSYEQEACDVNIDNTINVLDIINIVNIILDR